MFVKDENAVKQSIIDGTYVKVLFTVVIDNELLKEYNSIPAISSAELMYDEISSEPWQAYIPETSDLISSTTLNDLISKVINFIKSDQIVIDVKFKKVLALY